MYGMLFKHLSASLSTEFLLEKRIEQVIMERSKLRN